MAFNIYVSKELKPAVMMLQEAFVNHAIRVDDVMSFVVMMINGKQNGNQHVGQYGTLNSGQYGNQYGNQYSDQCGDQCKEETKKGVPPTPLFTKEEKEEKKCKCKKETQVKKGGRFSSEEIFPPTLEMVREEHKRKGITLYAPEEFFDYYEAFGWTTKENRPVSNWRALMNLWATSRERYLENNKQNNKSRNNGKGHTNTHAQAGREEDERRELLEYLDTYYPADETPWDVDKHPIAMFDTAAALARRVHQLLDSGTYATNRQSSFTNPDIVKEVKEKSVPTLKEMANAVGRFRMIRLMTKHLYYFAKVLEPNKRHSPNELSTMAIELMGTANSLTMDEMLLFLNKIRQGDFGRFNKGLYVVDMNVAMKEFLKWRNKVK